jgi:N-methylhydantoinase B
MSAYRNKADDPIVPEILRTRLEAIGQEAGAAVEQTAISPIVTESKDYSVTICDADGAIISATGVSEIHFGAAMHAVRSTIARHGDSAADGDVFIANDPHSGGGVHPQDVVIQRPVFVDGQRIAWVALVAHMMDMGGMVPGSSAPQATECYQEALRLPPIRLIERHEEVADVWNIIRINIRSAALVEMDMRSLVIGGAVAAAKLVDLVSEMGLAAFQAATRTLLVGAEAVLRERIQDIEDGHYISVARVEFRDALLRIPCDLMVSGDRLLFDLREAPAQVPHFFNSKAYILRAVIAPRLRHLLAPGLPYNQAIYDVIEIATKSGTIVDCVMPAPIAAAHMDAAMAVDAAAWQCLQFAIYASPRAAGRQFMTAPAPAAYGVGRWNYLDSAGQRRVYTLLDGALCGSPAAHDRDGIDLKSGLTDSGSRLEYADVEILEAAYPILFRERGFANGFHGYGRFRSGAGCREAFQPHGADALIGNMTGTRSWFPTGGSAGGLPGARTRFAVARADGRLEPLHVQAVGVSFAPGDHFEMRAATAGGYGDPLDREPAAILRDVEDDRLDRDTAREVYGIVFAANGEVDLSATQARRQSLRRDRLNHARPAPLPAQRNDVSRIQDTPSWPLYPGVVQRGDLALAEESGALLAVAPGNWLDGCPVLETPIDQGARGVIARAHLDPLTGRMLYVDVVCASDGPSIEIRPERWVRAGTPTDGWPSRAASPAMRV